MSHYYTIMLMVQALVRVQNVWRQGKQLESISSTLFAEDLPLVLVQALVHTLQTQQSNGSWEASAEVTSYALLIICALKAIPQASYMDGQIQHALQQGSSFLLSGLHLEGSRAIDYLWIEKVTYGSYNLSQAYIIAALHGSASACARNVPINGNSSTSREEDKLINLYRHLPLLQGFPSWLLRASLVEANCFAPKLKRKCKELFQGGVGVGKHLAFIPLTWTVTPYVAKAQLGADTQLAMMIISALLYTLDQHMEAVVGARTRTQRQTLKETIEAAFSYAEEHDQLHQDFHLDETLDSFVKYLWNHAKVQAASIRDRKQLIVNLRLLLLTHLTQVEDNQKLQTPNGKEQPLPTASVANGTSDSNHGSLFRWVQTISGFHTGGGVAFWFLMCLISSGSDVFESSTANYVAEELSLRLCVQSRLQNDFGSLERDREEGNLNSRDFLSSNSKKPHHDKAQNGVLDSSRDEILSIARYERRAVERLLHEELPTLCDTTTIKALEVFTAAVDMYGEMYVLKDHTESQGVKRKAEEDLATGRRKAATDSEREASDLHNGGSNGTV